MRWQSIKTGTTQGKNSIKIYRIVIIAAILFISYPVWAGPVTDQIKQKIDKALTVLKDQSLKAPGMENKRRAVMRSVGDELFDWEEMAKRSLAVYWRDRSPEEKKEFTKLFTDLLEHTYMGKIESYSGEKILYTKETVEDQYALVETKVVTKQDVEYPVNYWVINRQGRWLVYDVSIEGVSLVKNYRTQFNEILARSSYQELVKKLKEKQESPAPKS
ncbi:MAG: ABC transporter substrate-binding protein [Proteobacteria bacterium]|nr:ABC transporter substrate-binding protein [Pseudomonadota bacterium]